MSVSGRLAAAVLLAAFLFVPDGAAAAPILLGADGPQDGDGCPSGAANCRLFEIDPISASFTGHFTADNDVALLAFVLGPGSFSFSAFTTSAFTNFDPILTLFGPGGALFTYSVGDEEFRAQAFEVAPDTDPVFPTLTLAGNGTYTLAISQFGPSEGSFALGALDQGFSQDAFPCFTSDVFAEACSADASLFGGQTGTFALDLALTPQGTASVPEPATLSLFAIGVATAAVTRRRRSRR